MVNGGFIKIRLYHGYSPDKRYIYQAHYIRNNKRKNASCALAYKLPHFRELRFKWHEQQSISLGMVVQSCCRSRRAGR